MSEKKPAALKTDDNGHCIHVCRIGQLEYIHRLITEDGLSQQEACRNFIDAVKAHVSEGDPIVEDMTIERVRSQFRRDSGKLIDKPKKSLVGPTKEVAYETALTDTDEGCHGDEKHTRRDSGENIDKPKKSLVGPTKQVVYETALTDTDASSHSNENETGEKDTEKGRSTENSGESLYKPERTVSTRFDYPNSADNLKANTIVTNIISARKQISNEFIKLNRFIDTRKLANGTPLTKIENEVRLLVHEAEVLNIYPFGIPIESLMALSSQRGVGSAQLSEPAVTGA